MKKFFFLFLLFSSPVYAYNVTSSVGYGLDQVGVQSSSDVSIVCDAGKNLQSLGSGNWGCVASGSSTTVPTGTGFVHINAGNQDAAARAVNLSSDDVTGTLSIASGGTGITTTPGHGQLLIGNGVGYSLASLTSGSNVTITNGAGTITIAATGGAGSTVFPMVSEDGTALTSADTINFTTGLKATNSGTKVTVSGDMATTTTPGIASFDSSQFSVGNFGGVSITGVNRGLISNNLATSVDVLVAASHNAVTLAGENYLSLSGQQITANPVNLSGTNITSTLGIGNGGTGLTSISNDAILVGNNSGNGFDKPALPDCQDTGGNHLNYTASVGAFACGTSSSGGAGSSVFPMVSSDGVAVVSASVINITSPMTVAVAGTVITTGVSFDVMDVVSGNRTWNKPSWAKTVFVRCVGAGGGGGPGVSEGVSNQRNGGGGGGGASLVERIFSASDLTTTVAVSVPSATPGGLVSNSAGYIGGPSTFGTYLTAFGGGGGGGPNPTTGASGGGGGGGGGWGAAGSSGTAGTGGAGGGPGGTAAGNGSTNTGFGGAGGANFAGAGGSSAFGGSSGGGGGQGGGAGGIGGSSMFACPGGGSGGSINNSNPGTNSAGTAGGKAQSITTGGGGTAGTSGGGTGGDGNPGTQLYCGAGGGGGGASNSGAGGPGGNGGFPGGGGGGGGGGTGSSVGGAGGRGGAGRCTIFSW